MNFLIYLFQVSACTAIFYLFYYLFLSKLTFFVLNRWYLLGSIFLSFVIPSVRISVDPQVQQMPVMQQIVYVNTLQSASSDLPNIQIPVATENPMDWMLLLKTSYLSIVSVLAIHLIVTLIILFKRLSAKKITKVGTVNILYNQPKLPNGSFFNYIFLNDQELSADERQQIIAHEMLHVKLHHSIDRMVVKIAQIILWFNPFIYFFSKSIEENHEFEVDRAMANSTDKSMYADLLLHLSVAGQGMLYHNFSKIPLKKRITMLFNKPSAKMRKVIYGLIVPVILVSCLAFAQLKSSSQDKEYSVIDGVEKLGKNPLVLIDGKVYGKEVLYKIGNSCIKSMGIWSPDLTIKKHGILIKDGFVEITTKNGKVSYITPLEKENLIKERNVPKNQFYTRLRLKDGKGGFFDKIIVQMQEPYGRSATKNISVNGKAVFLIDNKLYTENQIERLSTSFIKTLELKGVWFGTKYSLPTNVRKFDALFTFNTKKDSDIVKDRQKVKRTPEEIKGEAAFKAYRQTDEFKQKEKLAKDITGKTITVKIKDTINRDARKNSDMFISNNGKVRGFLVVYNGNEYFIPTKYGQEKQLNNLLKVGDEITLKVFGSTFGKNTVIIIQPASIYKNNVKIFQLAEAEKIPDYPFLYERNKVRFADGQITHIQKYPNGKWKSARLEIVNGYQFTLNFKPTAPNFDQIEDSDHVRLRFVHEVKTGAKTYQINDWVTLSTDIKDYGIKNPDFFYKFYTPI
ncbi:M56 family metallopeptidase [uncultured Mucilaginibacter sp.]|uniref:M56 family metallopeptidase n=1 Tax=uncultured Mucilaginibacter sp. TaxID=797541 RepID=UPI0026207F3B|nr:M56 family metallopeptidase [uncultured Mucilaginibacter sp.]